MTTAELQAAIATRPDGVWGPQSRAALRAAFTNRAAPAVTPADLNAFAARLGVSLRQLRAVARVESSGSGFDAQGRPKILFERHKFHAHTGGRWSPCAFSNARGGGYRESSWTKLDGAIATGAVDAAFMACSWGRFQVLGEWWDELGYESPFAFARSTVISEAAHFEMLCLYVERFALQPHMRAISADAESCRAFARAYNGPRYEAFGYHDKLARAAA